MPDLYHSLLSYDLGHLRIVAESWGVELKSKEADSAAKELSASLLDPGLVAEIIASLTPEARQALSALVKAGGRIPYAAFTRRFGEVREMGAGRRDRERPHLTPASTAEVLFYRAMLARAFFDTEQGPQEFAYLPDDMLKVIHHREHEVHKENAEKDSARSVNSAISHDLLSKSRAVGVRGTPAPVAQAQANGVVKSEPLGRAATPGEHARVIPANDRILDDATTLLAALRTANQPEPAHDSKLLSLLQSAGLLKKSIPQAEAVRKFLEASRPEAMKMLNEAWESSETFNELRLTPGLVCEGEWKNPVRSTRETVLGFLSCVPPDRWWGLDAFIHDIKKQHPDFQRPAGDYDSWFIRRPSDGQYLRGFDSWDEVDGALIRFFIQILHWLGRLDLAAQAEGYAPVALRLVASDAKISPAENGKLKISSTGGITAPRLTPRAVRYQLARFCEWGEEKVDEYRYRITPASLTKAAEQGLKVEHLLALLAKHSDAGIPPSLVKALKRWESNGIEARAETQVVLRVSRPEVLEELRKSRAARFLGEPLGPTAVVIKAGAQSKVTAALAEMGLLAEDGTEGKES